RTHLVRDRGRARDHRCPYPFRVTAPSPAGCGRLRRCDGAVVDLGGLAGRMAVADLVPWVVLAYRCPASGTRPAPAVALGRGCGSGPRRGGSAAVQPADPAGPALSGSGQGVAGG